MGVINGSDLQLYINRDGKNYCFCHARNCKITFTSDLIETTTQGSGSFKSYDYGFRSYTLQLSGISVLGDAATFFDLQRMIVAGEKMSFTLGDPANINVYYEGRVLLSNVDLDTSFDNIATFTSDLQGDGQLKLITQTVVKQIVNDGSGLTETTLNTMLEPWPQALDFVYDGTNNIQTLDFIPNRPASAELNGEHLIAFRDYYFDENKVVIDKNKLDIGINYILDLYYFK